MREARGLVTSKLPAALATWSYASACGGSATPGWAPQAPAMKSLTAAQRPLATPAPSAIRPP
jgi:hypothetical protein